MEIIYKRVYNFWLKETSAYLEDYIPGRTSSGEMFDEIFDPEHKSPLWVDSEPLGKYYTSLAIQMRTFKLKQIIPFIMIDEITGMIAALHLENGEKVS